MPSWIPLTRTARGAEGPSARAAWEGGGPSTLTEWEVCQWTDWEGWIPTDPDCMGSGGPGRTDWEVGCRYPDCQ